MDEKDLRDQDSTPTNTYHPEKINPIENSKQPQNGKNSKSIENSKKFFAKRKKYVKRGAIGILLIIGLFTLPLPIGSIEINGSNKITASDIVTAGNLGSPVNILRVNTSKLENNLSHDLRIESAKVSYALPLTLKVEITERKGLGVVFTQFGYATLDKDGNVINLGPAIEDTTVPILSGIKLGNILLGDTVSQDGVKNALTYLNSLTEEGRKNISEINIGDSSMMIAYTVDGLPVHIGDNTDLEAKAQLTEDMIKDVKNRHVNAEYIDVNVKAPFIKMN